ncbi:hypothetical protein FRC12_021852, partial [Ceratobasidium sp. 428]
MPRRNEYHWHSDSVPHYKTGISGRKNSSSANGPRGDRARRREPAWSDKWTRTWESKYRSES